MLIPILVLLQQPAGGVKRFHDFFEHTAAFSVKFTVTSNVARSTGTGNLIVRKPNNIRLSVDWGSHDYTLVKAQTEVLEFVAAEKLYQVSPDDPGIVPYASSFPNLRMEAMPWPLVMGAFQSSAAPGSSLKFVSLVKGIETDSASWEGPNAGKLLIRVDSVGRLLTFDFKETTMNGLLHRVFEFKDYVINPAIPVVRFSTEPPLGFVAFQQPPIFAEIKTGDTIHLGSWKSASGSVNLDRALNGKLLIVHEQQSPPAAALLHFLASQKLEVETVDLSLGQSGGKYNSPEPSVAHALQSMGTPLLVLLDAQAKIKAMWVGFDSARQDQLLDDIKKAISGNQDE